VRVSVRLHISSLLSFGLCCLHCDLLLLFLVFMIKIKANTHHMSQALPLDSNFNLKEEVHSERETEVCVYHPCVYTYIQYMYTFTHTHLSLFLSHYVLPLLHSATLAHFTNTKGHAEERLSGRSGTHTDTHTHTRYTHTH